MKTLRHIGIGFLVSFIGSLPLGYLNVAGLEVYRSSGIESVGGYLLGVVSVEVFVIYFTLVFADRLVRYKKTMRFIEGFSAVFMLALAVYFYLQAEIPPRPTVPSYDTGSSYVLGVALSGVNFLQIPFWTGWNLYLLNKNLILAKRPLSLIYISGTALGTFFGMLAFILSVSGLETTVLSGFLMHVIALAFGVIGVWQGVKFYRKYYAAKEA